MIYHIFIFVVNITAMLLAHGNKFKSVNSNTILKSNGLRYYSDHVYSEEKTVRLTFDGHFAGILIVDQNKYTNIYAVGASSGIKQISIGNADSPQPSKSGNTISIPMRAWSSFILITNDNSVIKL